MKIRYYFDEHIADAIAKGLRRRGIDVLTLVEAGKLGADDEAHFAFAHQQGRVIVTHDDDFFVSRRSHRIILGWFTGRRGGGLGR